MALVPEIVTDGFKAAQSPDDLLPETVAESEIRACMGCFDYQ